MRHCHVHGAPGHWGCRRGRTAALPAPQVRRGSGPRQPLANALPARPQSAPLFRPGEAGHAPGPATSTHVTIALSVGWSFQRTLGQGTPSLRFCPSTRPLFGAKIFHCTGHCAGRTSFGKKTLSKALPRDPNHQNTFRRYTTNKPCVTRDMSYPTWYMHALTAERFWVQYPLQALQGLHRGVGPLGNSKKTIVVLNLGPRAFASPAPVL